MIMEPVSLSPTPASTSGILQDVRASRCEPSSKIPPTSSPVSRPVPEATVLRPEIHVGAAGQEVTGVNGRRTARSQVGFDMDTHTETSSRRRAAQTALRKSTVMRSRGPGRRATVNPTTECRHRPRQLIPRVPRAAGRRPSLISLTSGLAGVAALLLFYAHKCVDRASFGLRSSGRSSFRYTGEGDGVWEGGRTSRRLAAEQFVHPPFDPDGGKDAAEVALCRAIEAATQAGRAAAARTLPEESDGEDGPEPPIQKQSTEKTGGQRGRVEVNRKDAKRVPV